MVPRSFYAKMAEKQEKRAFFGVFLEKSAIFVHFSNILRSFYAILPKNRLKRAF